MAIAAPELAAIIAASRPAPAAAAPAPSGGGGGAQVLFGLMLLGVGIFLAWLFSTGRLKAVQTAIATGVAPAAVQPATDPTTSTPATSNAPGQSFLATTTAPSGVGTVGLTYDPTSGNLTAAPLAAASAYGSGDSSAG